MLSLWKRGQNLNIDLMQCETKIPVLPVFLHWGLFIAVVCVFLGVVQRIILYPQRSLCLHKVLLFYCFLLCIRACSCVSVWHQLDKMLRMKYHLLLDSAAHSGNHQVNSLSLPADLEGCWGSLLSWSSPSNGQLTDRLLTSLVDSGVVCWGKCCHFPLQLFATWLSPLWKTAWTDMCAGAAVWTDNCGVAGGQI